MNFKNALVSDVKVECFVVLKISGLSSVSLKHGQTELYSITELWNSVAAEYWEMF